MPPDPNKPGTKNLKHIVVLMMENRPFDHMLGALQSQDARIDGLAGTESNPDTTGEPVTVEPTADFLGQLDPDPDHSFPAVDLQIYGPVNGALQTGENRVANMQGFVRSYYNQQRNVQQSHKILYYFTADKLPVLTTLATEFALFTRWFAAIPGPTICNRAFAHYGTSFGQVDMNVFYVNKQIKSIYERLIATNPAHTAKLYYYDEASSTMEVVNLLQSQPQLFGTFDQFKSDCAAGVLPDYSFIEPNYTNHDTETGEAVANDQHPDHDVRAGEQFIADVYNHIRGNPDLWSSTAMLIVYDEHGGIYDHVPPPACLPDGFVAQPASTGTPDAFHFDRLGVRVPAILVSPWVAKGTVISDRVFEHASIPATVTDFFIGSYDARTDREKAANTFLDLLSLDTMRDDCPEFQF